MTHLSLLFTLCGLALCAGIVVLVFGSKTGRSKMVFTAFLGILAGISAMNIRQPDGKTFAAASPTPVTAPAPPLPTPATPEPKPQVPDPKTAPKRATDEKNPGVLASWLRKRNEQKKGASVTPAKREPKIFQDLNCSLDLGSEPWTDMNPKSFGSDACYMGSMNSRKLMLSVIVEPFAFNMDSTALTEILKTNTQGLGKLTEWKILEPLMLANVQSPCVAYEIEINGNKASYVNIHHVDHGYARQFVLASTGGMPLETLRMEAAKVAEGFKLIDPDRVGGSTMATLNPAKFPEWGCAMKAGGRDWTQISPAERIRGQIWHGNYRGTSHLVIVPISLKGIPVDFAALAKGLICGSTGREMPGPGTIETKLSSPKGEGVEYQYRETLDSIGDYQRIIRVIRRGDTAWLIDSGTRAGVEERVVNLRKAIDGFTVEPDEPGNLPKNDSELLESFHNQAGLSYYLRGLYPEARVHFEKALQLAPDRVIYFINVLDTFSEEGNPLEIVKKVQAAAPSMQAANEVKQRLAHAHASLGRFAEAKKVYTQMFQGDFRNDDSLQEATNFLLENSGKADALELVEKYIKGGTNQRLDRIHAYILTRNDRHADAAGILAKLHTDAPGNNTILVELADSYAKLKRHPEAISLFREALTKDPKNPLLLFNLGYQLADSEKYEEAAEILEGAAMVSPKDETILDELAFVRSRLGRGHDREIRTPLPAITLPASLEVPTDWSPSSVPQDSDRYQLQQSTVYLFKTGTPLSRTVYNDVLMLTDRAVGSLSTLRFEFSPLSERIYVNKLEVIGSDGKVVATGKEKDQYITDTGGEEATARKILCVPVPGLAVGSRLKYTVTYSDRSPSSEFSYESRFFFTRYGARTNSVCVRGDIASIQSRTIGAVETKEEDGAKIWSVANLPASPDESNIAELERFTPVLYLGPNGTDWTKIGDSYENDIANQLAVDPDIESLARDLVSGTTEESEKIKKLYRWVQTEFTYKAIEFGTRARIPHSAAVTCANRYGDCKDLSIVLHAMLRAVGIASHPCLVSTSSLLVREIPSLDQFNHMIVYVPASGAREACWLDPTDRNHGLVAVASPWLEGRETFIVDKAASRFVTVPQTSYPSPHLTKVKRSISPGKGTDLMVNEVMDFHGYSADGMRFYIGSIPAAERLQRVREWISSLDPSLTVDTLEVKNLKDQDLPFILEISISASDFLDSSGHLKRMPVSIENHYLRPVSQLLRVTPFAIYSGWSVQATTTGSIKLPAAVQATKASDPSWGDWGITSSDEKETWQINFSGSLRQGNLFKPESYPAFHEFWSKGTGQLSQPWRKE